jgi:glycosyltransferase involved in cell wall biosynthesis
LADVIITDSQSRRADIQQFVRRRDLKIKVIPNGIPPPLPMRSRDEMRQALAMPDSPATRVVGQISRLVSFKGQSLLLKAARTVLDEYPNAFFLVIGYAPDPSYQKRLVKQAADLGISDRVRITGYVGPIGDVWQMIDLQAHASLLDSLPNAIIEGMSLGKTAVVTPVGGIPEAVEHGKTGLVVPPGDPKALSAALLRLLREPDTAEGMGKAAYKRYEERYRPEIMSTAIEECFQEVVR